MRWQWDGQQSQTHPACATPKLPVATFDADPPSPTLRGVGKDLSGELNGRDRYGSAIAPT
jgi:hypothetical protein